MLIHKVDSITVAYTAQKAVPDKWTFIFILFTECKRKKGEKKNQTRLFAQPTTLFALS